jgi:hypothetical protein
MAQDAARTAFDAYEDFLAILDNDLDRKLLTELDAPGAEADSTFVRAKDAARNFQDGLSKLFFGTNEGLAKDAQSYGVF